MLRRLRNIFPPALTLKIYKTYIQPKLDYGITVWGCTTETNLNRVQRVQNHAARLITGNFDYIHTRGVDLVKSLKLFTIRERRDYFLNILTFKAIHGLVPNYLSNEITMKFDINGYDTRSSDGMDVYLPRVNKDSYRNSFLYAGGVGWNALPDHVKDSHTIESFKSSYKRMH